MDIKREEILALAYKCYEVSTFLEPGNPGEYSRGFEEGYWQGQKEQKELAENRGAFIDWVIENYPDIAKKYNGF